MNLIVEKDKIKIWFRYEDIYVPAIYSLKPSEIEKAPWKEKGANLEDYFNYGFNEEQWEKYSEKIRGRFDELRERIKQKMLPLVSENDALSYLLKFPSDYGGLGDIFTEEYDNVNVFDNKTNFAKMIPFAKGEKVYINLEQVAKLPSGSVNINPIINSNNFGNIPKTSSETINFNINQPTSNFYPPNPLPNTFMFRPQPFFIPMPFTIPKSTYDALRYEYSFI